MSAPERIQLQRTKGWRKPDDAVVVSRPSKWGNPYRVGSEVVAGFMGAVVGCHIETAAEAVALYRATLLGRRDEIRAELAGKDLACWCPLDQPCHADVLLEVANS